MIFVGQTKMTESDDKTSHAAPPVLEYQGAFTDSKRYAVGGLRILGWALVGGGLFLGYLIFHDEWRHPWDRGLTEAACIIGTVITLGVAMNVCAFLMARNSRVAAQIAFVLVCIILGVVMALFLSQWANGTNLFPLICLGITFFGFSAVLLEIWRVLRALRSGMGPE